MRVLILFVILARKVRGEELSVEFIQNERYDEDGTVHLDDLVNFIRPAMGRDSKKPYGSIRLGEEDGDDLRSYSFDTRRSDKLEISENPDPRAQGHSEPVIHITQEIPVPYPVRIEKKVHYPVPIPVEQPVPVHVPQPYAVRIEKKVPVPVAVPVPQPFPVQKNVPVPVEIPVDNPVPYVVFKPVPFYIQRNVPQPITKHVPLKVEVPIGVNKEVQIPVKVDKKMPLFIPKPVPYEIKIPIEKIYKMEIPVPYPVNVENQMASNKRVQITMSELVDGARYLFEKSIGNPVNINNGKFQNIERNE